jgi:hypothetical protein
MVEPFIPLAKEIDQDKDKRLAGLHADARECMSIHSAATWLLDNQPWDFFAVYYDAIDHFCHGFMKYHPPRQPWIGERDFELYHNVVSMAYQFHDQMLGTLLEKAGDGRHRDSDVGSRLPSGSPAAASIPDIPAGPAIEHRDLASSPSAGRASRKRRIAARAVGAGHRAHHPDALRTAGGRRHGRQGAFAGLREDAEGRVHSELGRSSGRGWAPSAAYAARSGGGARSAGADDRAGVYRAAG